MLIEVDKLTGRALIWASIRARGEMPYVTKREISFRTDHGPYERPLLIEQEAAELMRDHWIGLERPSRGQTPPTWCALANYVGPTNRDGSTPAVVSSRATDLVVAVYRAFIKSRFGETVEIPDSIAAEQAAKAEAEAF